MDVYTYQYYYNSVLSKLDITYVVERKFDMDNYYYGMSFFRMDNSNQATRRVENVFGGIHPLQLPL